MTTPNLQALSLTAPHTVFYNGWANDFSGNAYENHDIDAPSTKECEAHGCQATDLSTDDGGTMAACEDCESFFCPAHRVPSKDGHCDVCQSCRDQQEIDAVSPRFEE